VAAVVVRQRLYREFPIPLGLVVFLVQAALGIVLFAAFQEYVPRELGASAGWGGYLLAMYGAARVAFETPTGVLNDHVRRKVALLLGFLLLVPALVGMAGAGNIVMFGLLAAALGMGTAFVWPAIYAISADIYPPGRRGKVVGFLNVFQLLGFGAGALAGALLVERAHEAMFILAVAAMTAGGVCALLGTPSYDHEAGRAAGRARLRDVWSGQLAALSVLIVLATGGIALVIPAIRPYGDEVLGASFATVTVALIPAVLIGGALYVPAGHLSDRYGRMVPFLAGEVLLVAGAFLVAWTDVLVIAAVGGALIFAGNVFVVPTFNAAVMDLAPESHRGTLIGFTVALTGLGVAIGPAAGGALVDLLSAPAVFRLAGLVAVVTALGVIAYSWRFPGPADGGPSAAAAPQVDGRSQRSDGTPAL
jgi:MFS family permease